MRMYNYEEKEIEILKDITEYNLKMNTKHTIKSSNAPDCIEINKEQVKTSYFKKLSSSWRIILSNTNQFAFYDFQVNDLQDILSIFINKIINGGINYVDKTFTHLYFEFGNDNLHIIHFRKDEIKNNIKYSKISTINYVNYKGDLVKIVNNVKIEILKSSKTHSIKLKPNIEINDHLKKNYTYDFFSYNNNKLLLEKGNIELDFSIVQITIENLDFIFI